MNREQLDELVALSAKSLKKFEETGIVGSWSEDWTNLYVVEALRWGDREKHSYIVGVFSNMELALAAAEYEAGYRGGKYECVVVECNLDKPQRCLSDE